MRVIQAYCGHSSSPLIDRKDLRNSTNTPNNRSLCCTGEIGLLLNGITEVDYCNYYFRELFAQIDIEPGGAT